MSPNTFWCPATEPTGKDIEKILYSAFLQNIFCTQHAAAVREAAFIRQKRKREFVQQAQKKGEDGDEQKEVEEEQGGVLARIVTSLVRASGLPYQLPPIRPPSPKLRPMPEPSCEAAGGPQQIYTITQEEEVDMKFKNVEKPRSALAILIEEVRTKERQKKSASGTNDNLVSIPKFDVQLDKPHDAQVCQSDKDDFLNNEDFDDFGVALPLGPSTDDNSIYDLQSSHNNTMKHPSQMSKEEFLQQFKRAPRRGEIGYDADSVAAAEALGYVMSGSRNREKQHYVDSIQRKLHEKEARKLRLQFRKVEDERNDNATVQTLLTMVQQTSKNKNE